MVLLIVDVVVGWCGGVVVVVVIGICVVGVFVVVVW